VAGVVAYAGRYSLHGDRVVHHVELSLFPNWVGTDQMRSVEGTGDRADPQRQPTALAGTQQVPPPGLGAARPLPQGRLIGWPPQEAGDRKPSGP
jgi:hypothetical protein